LRLYLLLADADELPLPAGRLIDQLAGRGK
jgi:hypothetical protein